MLIIKSRAFILAGNKNDPKILPKIKRPETEVDERDTPLPGI